MSSSFVDQALRKTNHYPYRNAPHQLYKHASLTEHLKSKPLKHAQETQDF